MNKRRKANEIDWPKFGKEKLKRREKKIHSSEFVNGEYYKTVCISFKVPPPSAIFCF